MFPFGGGMGGLGGGMGAGMPYGPMGGMGSPGGAGGMPDPRMAMMMRAQMGGDLGGEMGGLGGQMPGLGGPMSSGPGAMGGGPFAGNPMMQAAYMRGRQAGLGGSTGGGPMGGGPMGGGGGMPGAGMAGGAMGAQMGMDARQLAMMQMQGGGAGGLGVMDPRAAAIRAELLRRQMGWG